MNTIRIALALAGLSAMGAQARDGDFVKSFGN
jgi:hypothetical protein